MPALFDAALPQLKKIGPTLRQQKTASQHIDIEAAKPSCRKRRVYEHLPTDQASSANRKKGKFRTIVDKSVDIHRMICA